MDLKSVKEKVKNAIDLKINKDKTKNDKHIERCKNIRKDIKKHASEIKDLIKMGNSLYKAGFDLSEIKADVFYCTFGLISANQLQHITDSTQKEIIGIGNIKSIDNWKSSLIVNKKGEVIIGIYENEPMLCSFVYASEFLKNLEEFKLKFSSYVDKLLKE